MGLWSMGQTHLTDWSTPNVANDTYYLKLTVRDSAAKQFESPIVPVRVDNVGPTTPVINLALQQPDGTRVPLGCCETIERGDGNLVVISLQASDPNFSRISVALQGGCNVTIPIVDVNGVALSKTYNGDLTDTGYPALTDFVWDPFTTPAVEPCCYLVYVRIADRAIVNNFWSGGHGAEAWHAITIG
jgi:hypothetical protein